jgi:hypothetical protein
VKKRARQAQQAHMLPASALVKKNCAIAFSGKHGCAKEFDKEINEVRFTDTRCDEQERYIPEPKAKKESF